MKYVIKLGGASLEKPELLHAVGKAIAELVTDGHQVAIVHGGGVQLTRTLQQMGKQSEFVSGLRVTDAETRTRWPPRPQRQPRQTRSSS